MNLLLTSHIIMSKALQFVTVQSQVENSRSGQGTVSYPYLASDPWSCDTKGCPKICGLALVWFCISERKHCLNISLKILLLILLYFVVYYHRTHLVSI